MIVAKATQGRKKELADDILKELLKNELLDGGLDELLDDELLKNDERLDGNELLLDGMIEDLLD